MWARGSKDGKFQVQVWDVAGNLTFEGQFASAAEADRVGEEQNRKALAPLLGSYTMTAADWSDPLLDMSDDELLAALTA